MNRIAILIILLMSFVRSGAQTVRGRVVDSSHNAVTMATVALQTLDSMNIDYTATFIASATVPVSIRKWYNGNFVVMGYNDHYKCDDWYGYKFDRKKWVLSLSTSNSLIFSRKPMVALDVNAFYRTPSIVGLWNYSHN